MLKSEEGAYMLIPMAEVSIFFKSVIGSFICSGVMAIYGGGSPAMFFLCHGGSAQWNRESIYSDPWGD